MTNQKNQVLVTARSGLSRMAAAAMMLMLAVVLVSCSQVRDNSAQSAPADLSGMYPHQESWRAQHMVYYSKIAARSRQHNQACLGCHESKPKGRPLNISCGATCHEKRPARIHRVDTVAFRSVTNECTSCHAEKVNEEFPHHPVSLGLCNMCHEASTEHLSGSAPKAVKSEFSKDVCYSCHDRKDQEEHVHAALGTTLDCSNCHDPHGSKRGFFVRQETEELCVKCHKGVASGAHSQHAPAFSGQSCMSCHVPHAGPRAKLLNADPDVQCFSCHENMVQEFGRATVHGAMAEGCKACHSPHSSDHQKLLKNAYPTAEHMAFAGTGDYALCFQCHDTGLLDPASAGSTGFRNGNQNLHWIHVANIGGTTGPEWGRSCRICHEPHASDQSRLIKSAIGRYGVRMSFQVLQNGGQCMASCHSPKMYLR